MNTKIGYILNILTAPLNCVAGTPELFINVRSGQAVRCVLNAVIHN